MSDPTTVSFPRIDESSRSAPTAEGGVSELPLGACDNGRMTKNHTRSASGLECDVRIRNLRMTVAYDGTNFVGWQEQPNGTSVQSVIQTALRKLTGEDTKILAAGRTDSGVHAIGQVVSFHTSCTIPGDRFASALASHLPDDIVIRECTEARDDFHATHSAVRKHYRYVIFDGGHGLPFLSRYAWHFRGKLDDRAMHDAAQRLTGTHDFRCFESHFPNKATSVRTVTAASVRRHPGWPVWSSGSVNAQIDPVSAGRHRVQADSVDDDPPAHSDLIRASGEFIAIDISADGFLYNMVRAITGSLIRVGRGQWSPDVIENIIAGQDRSRAGETAPACGLYLVRVDYEDTR